MYNYFFYIQNKFTIFALKKKMQLFYNGSLTSSDKFTFFEKEESVHIHRVLRKKAGDIIHITDGKGNLYLAKIDTINDNKNK